MAQPLLVTLHVLWISVNCVSLKKNILFSYVSQIYVVLAGILIFPVYLQYMGAEVVGLVGFFTMLQAWFNLLDMGLTPTVMRETARFRGGVVDVLSYRRLLRALELVFALVALVGGGAMFLCASFVAKNWLTASMLPFDDLRLSLEFMAVGVALRCISGLYRGCISGSEQLVWLGSFNAAMATLRFVGVLPVMLWLGLTATVFFGFQTLVALIEVVFLIVKSRRLMPVLDTNIALGWSPTTLFAPIRKVLKFSLTIALAGLVWVLVTQTDKLVLSKLLTLTDYGYFTLAVLAASGVIVVSSPISSALLPRMARLQAEGNEVRLIALYRDATQIVAVIAVPTCLLLSLFAEQIMWLWTQDAQTVGVSTDILRFYTLGNGFLVLASFPYYLQYAKGDLNQHLLGSAFFVLLLIPTLLWATWQYGVIGAGYAWLCTNFVYFFFWIPLVHRRYAPGLHTKWLLKDIGFIVFFTTSALMLPKQFIIWPTERLEGVTILILIGIFSLLSAALGSSLVKAYAYRRLGSWFSSKL